MVTTSSPRPFELRRLEFVYEGQPELSKVRPAIVAVVNHDEDAVLVVRVTGYDPRPEFPGRIRIANWRQVGSRIPQRYGARRR